MEEYDLKYRPYNSDEDFEVHRMARYTTGKEDDDRHFPVEAVGSKDYFLFYCNEGILSIENDCGDTYVLNNTRFMLYKPCDEQNVYMKKLSSITFAVFGGIRTEDILNKLDLKCNVVYSLEKSKFKGDNAMMFARKLEYIIDELTGDRKYKSTIASGMMQEWLGLAARYVERSENKDNSEYIKKSIDYIRNNCSKDIDMDELIDMSYLSRSQFYLLFKKYTGTTPRNYQNNYRIDMAIDYLMFYDDYSVEEIAQKVGFKDPQYFIRLFKRKYNVTPKQYIKAYKDNKKRRVTD